MEYKEPIVTIIVPVHNTETTLQRCVDSLLAQDRNDYEVILVNDGSTDNSLAVCRQYDRDKRVRIIDQKNCGAAQARNRGLIETNLSSQYCCFVDSDDCVKSNYLTELLKIAGSRTLGVCNIVHHRDGQITVTKLNDGTYRDLAQNAGFLRLLPTGILNSPCNKIYDLQLIRYSGLRFNGWSSGEDAEFNLDYLRKCRQVVFTKQALYHYIHADGTASSSVDSQLYINYMRMQRQLLAWVPSSLHKYVYEFVYPQYVAMTLRYLRLGDYETPKAYMDNSLIRDAMSAHKCHTAGEWAMHTCLRLGWYRLATKL